MKKLFLTAAISLILTGAACAAPAEGEEPVAQSTENVVATENIAIIEEEPVADDTAAEGIQESKVAQKMTQAEKAHNAAVNDSWGGAITIIAMCIVVCALAVLSILFMIFGKISQLVMASKKKKTAMAVNPNAGADSHGVDSGDVIAAIAMALSEHFGEGHDMEDTILTIKKLRRAYSPWNSKIYNLRQMPDHVRNHPSGYPIQK